MRIIFVIVVTALLFFASFLWYQLTESPGPTGIVVPHHDMVAEVRTKYFAEISKQIQPETIILVSPDHFDRNIKPIVISDRTWETSIGNIKPDIELISKLSQTIYSDSFLSEHGITSLLKDIRQHFPYSEIVPILINRSATYEESASLAKELYQNCANCLLVASVDFSHTNDAMTADLHDTLAIRGLSSLNSVMLYKEAEVDSPESLAVLTIWAKLHNQNTFKEFSHTNSGFLSGVKSGEMTTHIIGGYYKGKETLSDDSVTFMIGGDLTLSRGVHQWAQKRSNLFEKIGDRFFWGVDVSLLNFEGYFTKVYDQSVWDMYLPLLPISTEHKYILSPLRVNTISLANNHSRDGGKAGFKETISTLKELNIDIINNNQNISESSIKIKDNGSVSVAFIGVYTHKPFTGLIEKIKELSSLGHHVVVYAHWGEEYVNIADNVQKGMAHDWIDAGADLVVGSHPHVVQNFEIYNGKPIVYSLGNFVFDQTSSKKVQVGAVLGGKFDKDALSLFVVPTNSYLEPYVLDNYIYSDYVKSWTEGWKNYLQDNGYFKFDLL